MTCEAPFLGTGGVYPCGRCPACLSKRRRTWAHRIMLEAYGHEGRSSFVTLTYAEAFVPRGLRDAPTLELGHLQGFIRSLRKRDKAIKVRYFACGEYGERSGRPHYHLALFGYPPC